MWYTCNFYGGTTGANFAKIWGRNIELTEGMVNSYTLANYNPNWRSNDTYLLTEFNNTLDGGNIPTDIGSINGWVLYRKEQNSNTLEYVSEFLNEDYEAFDYMILNDKLYQYYLFAKGTSKISNPIITDVIEADYYGWFLIDLWAGTSYQFDVEFEGGDKDFIEDFTSHQTNNTCNIYTKGGNKYVEGSIGGILSVDNLKQDIQHTNTVIENFREFIRSDRPKLLKSRRGEIYNVIVTEYKETVFNSLVGEDIYKVSFRYKEVGDIDGINL